MEERGVRLWRWRAAGIEDGEEEGGGGGEGHFAELELELKGESEEKKERGKSHPINKFGKQTRKDRRGEVGGRRRGESFFTSFRCQNQKLPTFPLI